MFCIFPTMFMSYVHYKPALTLNRLHIKKRRLTEFSVTLCRTSLTLMLKLTFFKIFFVGIFVSRESLRIQTFILEGRSLENNKYGWNDNSVF